MAVHPSGAPKAEDCARSLQGSMVRHWETLANRFPMARYILHDDPGWTWSELECPHCGTLVEVKGVDQASQCLLHCPRAARPVHTAAAARQCLSPWRHRIRHSCTTSAREWSQCLSGWKESWDCWCRNHRPQRWRHQRLPSGLGIAASPARSLGAPPCKSTRSSARDVVTRWSRPTRSSTRLRTRTNQGTWIVYLDR